MQQQSLVRMANQIGDFFRYQGDEDSAKKSIAAHLNHFWAPTMRRDLLIWLDDHEGEGLSPLVKASVEDYRGQLMGLAAQVPGEQKLEQPKGGGDAG